jgi:hypothetical protein
MLLGVISLSRFESAAVNFGELSLTSREKFVRLRGGTAGDPSVAEWFRFILDVISVHEKIPGSETSSRLLHRAQEQQSNQIQTNGFEGSNPLLDSERGKKKEVELSELASTSSEAAERGVHVTRTNVLRSSAEIVGGTEADLPPSFVALMVESGVIVEQNGLWGGFLKRLFFYVTYLGLPTQVVLSYISTRGSLHCSSSLKLYEKSQGYPPCLYVVSAISPNFVFFGGTVAIYTWLILNIRDRHSLLKTHRGRMRDKLTKFTLLCRRYQVFYVVCISVSVALDFRRLAWVESTPLPAWAKLLVYIFVVFPFYGVVGYFFSFISVPNYIMSLIYYSESRRLRLLLKDFLKLMKQRPFDYTTVSSAYTELVSEWEGIQSFIGPVMSLLLLNYSVLLILYSIEAFYLRMGNAVPVSPHIGHYETSIRIIQCVVAVILMTPIVGINLYTMLGANSRADAISEECTSLLAESKELSQQQRQQQARNGKLMTSESESLLSARDNIDSGQELELGQGGGVDGLSALKFVTLVERRPCQLQLFGRRFTAGDVAYYVSLLIGIQILNVIGLGSIFQ